MTNTERELLRLRIIRKLVNQYLDDELDPDETVLTIEEVLSDPQVDQHPSAYTEIELVETNNKNFDVV